MNVPSQKPDPQILLECAPELCETTIFDAQAESDENPSSSSSSCGRYLLDHLLGSGGFGEVWKGTDPSLNRPVAVKRLRTDRAIRPEAMTAFVEEGRKLALLKHPGIVSIFDAGMNEGQPFIVSELIAGGSLAARLKQETLSIAESCRIIRELAETLHYLHVRGIVHRDIKPHNILMESGQPKLADFGLAVSEFEQLTERPGVVGTYSYMSPEQVRGDSHLVDGRSDIYSLGVVFYQMLAGRKPFLGDSREQLQDQILKREPRPLRSINDQIPPTLEEICLKCLRKSMSERYSTARDLARDIEAFERTLIQPKARLRTAAWIAILLIGIGASAAFAWINRPAREKEQLPEPPANAKEEPPQPQLVKNLLGRPDLEKISDYKLDAAGRYLHVISYDRSLVSLGTAGDDDLELEVSISQLPWTGKIGVFFGFHPIEKGRLTRYHALYIFKVAEDNYELRASVYDYQTESPGENVTNHMLAQWRIDNFRKNAENTIRFATSKGKLTEVAFNGKNVNEYLLPKIERSYRVLRLLPIDCRGQFGLFNYLSSGRFMAPIINEEEVLFPVPKK